MSNKQKREIFRQVNSSIKERTLELIQPIPHTSSEQSNELLMKYVNETLETSFELSVSGMILAVIDCRNRVKIFKDINDELSMEMRPIREKYYEIVHTICEYGSHRCKSHAISVGDISMANSLARNEMNSASSYRFSAYHSLLQVEANMTRNYFSRYLDIKKNEMFIVVLKKLIATLDRAISRENAKIGK